MNTLCVCCVLFLIFTYINVNSGQFPVLEPLPNAENYTTIVTEYDQACMNANNDSSSNYVVYIGAIALAKENECEVVCQIQCLQEFTIRFGDSIRTRAILIGSIYTASMPDNSTCNNDSGICMGGMCTMTSITPTEMSMNMTTTEMNMNMTTMETNMTTMESNMTTMPTMNMTIG